MLSRERNSVETREPMHFKASLGNDIGHVGANERLHMNAGRQDDCAVNDGAHSVLRRATSEKTTPI
jgi:hypothetical protein